MNPLFRLKHQLPSTKDKNTKQKLKSININSPKAELSTRRIGGWKGYFVTVDGVEKQITNH